jgi:hypothetical protein
MKLYIIEVIDKEAQYITNGGCYFQFQELVTEQYANQFIKDCPFDQHLQAYFKNNEYYRVHPVTIKEA